MRQSAHEFEADELHQCPAWPIPYDEFEPYYDEAEQLLQLKHFETEPDLLKIVQALQRHDPGWRKEALPVGLSERILGLPNDAHHFDGFANPRGLKSDAECSLLHRVQGCENLRILTGTMAVTLNGTASHPEEIASVTCANGETYTAKAIVLAGGALNSPRLLQAYLNISGLAEQLPAAGHVGRNYKCHLNSAMIVFSASDITDSLRKTTILFHERFPHSSVQNLGWLDGELIAPELPRAAPHWVADFAGRHAYGFWITTEDGSHPDNRVVPASVGQPHGVIDYDHSRLSPAETEHKHLIHTLEEQLLLSGYAGFVKRMPIDNSAHACGTLRAGDDPTLSVVDRDGKVHGMANLYVADGSVMPRSGRVNPALTIYAWGLKLGDHLHGRIMGEA